MSNHDLPVIDWELALKVAGQKKNLAEDLLKKFLQCLPEHVRKIKKHRHNKKKSELFLEVHKLHSAICFCGLPRLRNAVANFEDDLRKKIFTHVAAHIKQLDIEVKLLFEKNLFIPNK